MKKLFTILFSIIFLGCLAQTTTTQSTGGVNMNVSAPTGILPIVNGGSASSLSTGTGAIVLQTAPTFSTSITTPLIYGGTSSGGNLQLTSTSHPTKGDIKLGSLVTIRESITDNPAWTSSFMYFAGKTPSNSVNAPVAVYMADTAVTQGVGVNEIQTLQVRMIGAATGNVMPIALSVGQENTGGGTITAFPSTGTAGTGLACNNGAFLQANGTTSGDNIGGLGRAGNGAKNYGLVGIAAVSDANINVGVFGNAHTSTGKKVGGYFQLGTTVPTLTDAALICDNTTATSDIFVARDNGTAVLTVSDGGAVTSTSTVTATDFKVGSTSIVPTSGTFTPTVTGFSADPQFVAKWIKIDKLVTVQLSNVNAGTSNATTLTMTNLPFASSSTANFYQYGSVTYKDNGVWTNSTGIYLINPGSTTVCFGTALSAASCGSFTAVGSKSVTCIIQYFTD